MKISAIVVTKNEAKNIGRCLASLASVADEIVVVDAYSQDETAQICASFPNVAFISCPWIGLDGMKSVGSHIAHYDHILNIAADEVLSPELQHNLMTMKEIDTTETIAMVNYVGRPYVNVEPHFEDDSPNKKAPNLIAYSSDDDFRNVRKN